MKHYSKVVVAGIFCVSFISFAYAQPPQNAAKLLPPETVALVQTRDFLELTEQFKKTRFYGLYKDPEMAAFVRKIEQQVKEKLMEDGEGVFKTIIDDKVLPEGRAAGAFVLNEKSLKAGEPMLFLMLDWGKNAAKAKTLAQEQDKKAVEDGCHIRKETFQGVELVTTVAEDSKRLDYGLASEFSYCFVDETFLASEDIEVLKFVIAHLKGASSSTLADDADYIAAIAATGPDHDINLYVNIRHLVKTFSDKDETGKTRQMLEKLGLDNVTAFAYSIGVARRPGSSCSAKICLKVNGAKKGLVKILELESGAVKVPPFLPSSVYSVTFLNLSISKAVEQLGMIFPQPVAPMYMPLPSRDDSGSPGPQLKADLVDHLGSQIIFAQSINKSAPQDSMPIETLVAVAVNNRTAVDKTLSFVHKTILAPGAEDSTRQLLGHTIYLVNPAFLPFFAPPAPTTQDPRNPTQAQTPSAAIAVTDTHLLVGSESTVERAIRMLSEGQGESISTSSWFNTAKVDIPSLVGMAVLQDNTASVELIWNLLRKKDASSASAAVGPANLIIDADGMMKSLDFAILPEFDKVKKYFAPSSFYGLSRPDGFFFEFNCQNSRN